RGTCFLGERRSRTKIGLHRGSDDHFGLQGHRKPAASDARTKDERQKPGPRRAPGLQLERPSDSWTTAEARQDRQSRSTVFPFSDRSAIARQAYRARETFESCEPARGRLETC